MATDFWNEISQALGVPEADIEGTVRTPDALSRAWCPNHPTLIEVYGAPL